MAIKYIYFIAILSIFYSCNQQSCDFNRHFIFDTTLEGTADTIQVGDTISYIIKMPNDAIDQTTGEIIDLSEWSPNPRFNSVRLLENDVIEPANKNYFELIGFFETIPNGEDDIIITFLTRRLENETVFEGHVICKEKGKYSLGISNKVTDLKLEDCPNRRVNLNYKIVAENFNNNLHLIDSSAYDGIFYEDDLSLFAGVVFVVK